MSDDYIQRRTFLKRTAAIAGGALALPAVARATPTSAPRVLQEPLKLGVASYSFRKFPREKAIEMTKALGTPYINIKSFHIPYELPPAEQLSSAAEFEAAGLQIVGGGVIYFEEGTDAEVRRYFDYAKNSRMPLIVVSGPLGIWPRVERFAKQYDIKVAIHNHGPGDERYPTPYEALAEVRDMDPRMGLCIDVGHTARTGTDVVRAIADAGSRLLDVHAKDLHSFEPDARGAVVGDGVMPFSAIFRQLLAMNYQGNVNLEYEVEGEADDPLPGMKQSFAHMRGILAGLASPGRAAASRDPRYPFLTNG